MRKELLILATAGLLLAPAGAGANNVASSTMHFEGALADAGGGVYTGTIAMTVGEYYVPGGGGVAISTNGGFDVYAKDGSCAYVTGYYGTGDWNCSGANTYLIGYYAGSPNDAYPQPGGPWGGWYDPDCTDWDKYSLELTANHWHLRYTPTSESPMSGTMNWATMFGAETDLGTQNGGHAGSAAHGGGARAWDWDCGWGVEVVPLELPGFAVSIQDLGGGQYHVTLTPTAGPVENTTTGDTYATIQDAIDASTNGDIINVEAGTYHNDPLEVNKQITLLGAKADVDPAGSTDRGGETILTRDDTRSGFYITASGVTINGFKLGTATAQSSRRVNIYNGATDVTIKCNIIMNTWQYSGHGVYISPTSDRAEVSYNTIDNPWWEGICNHGASDVVISNNTVRNVDNWPILTWGKATISGNTVSNCKDGIRADYAGSGATDRVEIIGNTVSYTEYAGISITGAHTYVHGNTVHHCNYWGSDELGDWDYASIHVEPGATNCVITGNTVYDGVNGIQTWANDVTITNNEVYDMGLSYGNEQVVGLRTYKNSAILVGSNWGSGDIDPTGLVIEHNSVHDNYWGLFYSADLTNGVNAEGNWWGDATGPADPNGSVEVPPCTDDPASESNTDGLANGVSDNVDYCPWFLGLATLTLNANTNAFEPGDTLTVTVDLTNSLSVIDGGQFYLAYNNTVLDFVGIVPGDPPFTNQIFGLVDEVAGTIDYAIGIPLSGTGTPDDSTMAVITFTTQTEACEPDSLVWFRPYGSGTRLTDDSGVPVTPLALIDLAPIIVDGDPPTIACPPGVMVECDSDVPAPAADLAEFVAQGGSASDDGGSVEVTHVGDVSDGQMPETITRTYRATDGCGNFSECDQLIIVDDNTGPVVTCPVAGTLTVYADEGECDAEATFGAATAMDNCDGALPATCNPLSGTVFPLGETVVTCSATDAAGNTGQCTFTVEVIETTEPVVTCPVSGTLTVYAEEGECDAEATFGAATAMDNCDGALPATCDPPSGTVFPLGETVVTCSATDASGNTGQCTFTVEVIEITEPVVTCPVVGTLTAYTDADTCTAVVTFADATATDNCDGVLPATCDPPSGSGFDLGQTVVTCSATDSSGNTGQCTFTVEVLDDIGPVVTCPVLGTLTVYADPGVCDAEVAFADATAMDNCDGALSATCNPAGGSIFPQGQTVVTCSAADTAGNPGECTFIVEVLGLTEVAVDVELSPSLYDPNPSTAGDTITRCITFELWECDGETEPVATAQQEIAFSVDSGLPHEALGVQFLVGCGNYTCITARDELHTLRSTATLSISGSQYIADFTGDWATGGHWLVNGNLNDTQYDDGYIDILDFGVFTSQWGTIYPEGRNTTCSTGYPHADVHGNGTVGPDSADFGFIRVNFGVTRQPNCCGRSDARDGGPLMDISVSELRLMGLGHLAVGDLNGDDRLNQQDIIKFMEGVRPQPRPQPWLKPKSEPQPQPTSELIPELETTATGLIVPERSDSN